MTIKTKKRHTRGEKSKAKKNWEKRKALSKKKARHIPKERDTSKKEEILGECVVCYDEVPIIQNNTMKCNNVTHILCAHCKLQLLNNNRSCPLCRGNHITPPKRMVIPYYIKVYKR